MALVLLYHRIATLRRDPQRLAVTPEHFDGHLRVLVERSHVWPLSRLADRAGTGRLPDRAVAVTFDDGYLDNLEQGKPLLERHGVPATIFLISSYLGRQRELWWDDLERCLLLPGRMPRRLRLRIGQTMREWDLEESSVYDEEQAARHAEWNVECCHDPTPRHRVYRTLCEVLRRVSAEEREATLAGLATASGAPDRVEAPAPGSGRLGAGTPGPDRLGVGAPGSNMDASERSPRPTHRVLTPAEVVRLTQGGAIEIGAHTSTHPALAALPLTRQRAEIADCRATLQSLVGHNVASFAYPFGSRADYTGATVALVRETGFTLACSARPGAVGRWSDRLQLPRMLVRDWDAETFAQRLDAWLGD